MLPALAAGEEMVHALTMSTPSKRPGRRLEPFGEHAFRVGMPHTAERLSFPHVGYGGRLDRAAKIVLRKMRMPAGTGIGATSTSVPMSASFRIATRCSALRAPWPTV
jgi:hypothetical protein